MNFNSLSNKEEAVLLKTIALFSHCAIRMARTDMFQATHVDINDCTTPNAQANRVLSAVDIGGDSNGELVSGSPGMCKLFPAGGIAISTRIGSTTQAHTKQHRIPMCETQVTRKQTK